MLKYPVNINSVQASNIFLRKLWSELNDIRPMGWELIPNKHGNTVYIGISTLGEISFDYSKKGCVKNIYIDNDSNKAEITKAIQAAKDNPMKEYSIMLDLTSDQNLEIQDIATSTCAVFSKNGHVYFKAGFEAYSEWDLDKILPSKYLSIKAIFYEYTHSVFRIAEVKYTPGRFVSENQSLSEYNYEWIDSDECPESSAGKILLPKEFFKLIEYILNDETYDERIELLINSSNLLFTTAKLIEEIPCSYSSINADIINSMACSTFEPLSLILDNNLERCKTCGNMVFSITQKIKNMCSKYVSVEFGKYVSNVIYKHRSAFLHEGHPETTQTHHHISCPQINPHTGSIMLSQGMVRELTLDYSAYLFRKISRDYFSGKLEQ